MTFALLSCALGAALTAGTVAIATIVSRGQAAHGSIPARVTGVPRSWVWPLRIARSLCAALPGHMPARVDRNVDRQLARAGIRDECEPKVWVAALALIGAFAAGVLSLGVAWLDWPPAVIGTAALLVPWVLHSQLRSRAERRASAIARELPAGIDLLVLCLESGASLGAAMRIASEKQGAGPVQQLWGEVLAQVRSGQPRVAALRRVMERLDLAPVTALFTALIQSDLRGMSLGAALRAQSSQCLADRFVRAERAALQAPVKLLLPLLTCIFPCTFIVIAIPIAARLIGAGSP